MSLKDIIKQKIIEKGAITVAEYMSLALSHPDYGYYMRKDPFGKRGDFITAPEISQVFGELIGLYCADMWQRSGGGDIMLVELGGGRGTLMKDALRATAGVTGFHESLCVTMVETSPVLREMQRDALEGMHSRIHWHVDLEELPRMRAIFIANEFFDALPIRQYIKSDEGLKEKVIELDPTDDDKFRFTVQQVGLQLVKGGTHRVYNDKLDDDNTVETCPLGRQIMQRICDHINEYGGAGLVIDYGYTGGSRGNSLQAVREHGFYPVLENPGKADITAHVDFDALLEILDKNNIPYSDIVSQGSFLLGLGVELRTQMLLSNVDSERQRQDIISGVERLVSPMQMGELFKVMSFGNLVQDDIAD